MTSHSKAVHNLKVYLVGGAVRDTMLALPIKDKDFLVTGATVDDMLAAGFTQVGADFPVFLHPKTHAEYALARLERKSGVGHTGFVMHTSPDVSVEEDLKRRDLTINAMAMQVKGLFDDTPIDSSIVDPFGGAIDLDNRVLRHVSPAFSEDPLRVLRVARFFARFYPQAFTIHPDTLTLMQSISGAGELAMLSRERIWSETMRALGEHDGWAYFDCLHTAGMLAAILPQLADLWADENIYRTTITQLKKAAGAPLDSKFALLFSGFSSSADDGLQSSFRQINMPKSTAHVVTAYLDHRDSLANFERGTAKQWLTLVESTKAHKDTALLHLLIDIEVIYQADFCANTAKAKLAVIINAYQSISMDSIEKGLIGQAIGDALSAKRLEAIAAVLDES